MSLQLQQAISTGERVSTRVDEASEETGRRVQGEGPRRRRRRLDDDDNGDVVDDLAESDRESEDNGNGVAEVGGVAEVDADAEVDIDDDNMRTIDITGDNEHVDAQTRSSTTAVVGTGNHAVMQMIDITSDSESDAEARHDGAVVCCSVHGARRQISPTTDDFSDLFADHVARYWLDSGNTGAHYAHWHGAKQWLLSRGCSDCLIFGAVNATSVLLMCSALVAGVALDRQPAWSELVQRHVAAMRNDLLSLDALKRALHHDRLRDIALESIFCTVVHPLNAFENGSSFCAANAAIQALASCLPLFGPSDGTQTAVATAWTDVVAQNTIRARAGTVGPISDDQMLAFLDDDASLGGFHAAGDCIDNILTALPSERKVVLTIARVCRSCGVQASSKQQPNNMIHNVILNNDTPSVGTALAARCAAVVSDVPAVAVCSSVGHEGFTETRTLATDSAQVLVVGLVNGSMLRCADAYECPGWSLRAIISGSGSHFVCFGLRQWHWPGSAGGEEWYEFDCLQVRARRCSGLRGAVCLANSAGNRPLFAVYERRAH